MIRILVIEREYGAGGSAVAEKAAQRLGWKLLDQELTAEIAHLAKIRPEVCKQREEKVDSWAYRLAKVFWRGSHERVASLDDSDIVDADRLVCITQKVVEEKAAAGGCVIVGRGAPYFLRDREDTLSVFLYGSRDVKYHRVRLRIKDDAEAIHLVDTVDEERAEFIRHYFKAQWPSRHLYDVMLNTDAGEDETLNTILHLMDAANKKQGANKA